MSSLEGSSLQEKLQALEKSMEAQIEEVENELRDIQQPSSLMAVDSTRDVSHALASHWEQVLSFAKQGQNEEAIYALVRVVQRLLDEKAYKRTLNEKANKSYVDSLFERVSSRVKDSIQTSTTESLKGLQEQVVEVRERIAEVRKYMQIELQNIRLSIDKLKKSQDPISPLPEPANEADGSEEEAPPRTQQTFIVHPHRMTR